MHYFANYRFHLKEKKCRMMNIVAEFVEHYKLLPHPEGGYYKETYRSNTVIEKESLPEEFSGKRNICTAIYFLLEQGNFSAFHRIKSDECWHFYAGQQLLIYVLEPSGHNYTIRLGSNAANGEVFQAVVPANSWFASEPAPKSAFCFVGCTVSPGFDFEDFELAKAEELINVYPSDSELIYRLCRQ